MKLFGYELSIKKCVNQHFPTITSATYSKETLKITYSNDTIKEYHGEYTVWCFMLMMKRCSTIREGELFHIWKYIDKYGNPYPVAHLKERV